MGRPNGAPRPPQPAKARQNKRASRAATRLKMASKDGPFRTGDIVETPWQRNRFVVIEANGLHLTVHRLADEAKEPLLIDARDVTRVD